MIPRYNIFPSNRSAVCHETPVGEWCRWEDVEKELARLDQLLNPKPEEE